MGHDFTVDTAKCPPKTRELGREGIPLVAALVTARGGAISTVVVFNFVVLELWV